MRKYTSIYIVSAILLVVASSCRTSEANYRAAYEKAIAGRDSLPSIESTIYGKHRRNTTSSVAVVGKDTVEMISTRVRVTEGGGGVRENLKPYSVVVGQFKQLVNAKSLRERLVDAGYPKTFVVETAEPYYYILVNSFPNKSDAVKECARISSKGDFPIPLKDGMPMVLYTPR